MKSSDSCLEKKIDSIVECLDLLEIEKEPLSKCSEHFLEYIKKKVDSSESGIIKGNPFVFMSEYESFMNGYDTGISTRVNEWKTLSGEKLSELLMYEAGMSKEDMELLKKPFKSLMVSSGFISQISRIFSSFDMNFSVEHNGKKLSAYNFFNRIKYNKCSELSWLYNLSIDTLVDIADMHVDFASKEVIGKRLFETVHLPILKKQGENVNEEEERRGFSEFLEAEGRMCKEEINHSKIAIVKNIRNIDLEYSLIMKENKSLKEYIEKELWA
ncbi:MAG: hypothetical protein V1886_00925 [archaeon]